MLFLSLTIAAGLAGANAWVLRAARGRIHEEVGSVPARPVAIVLGARVWADGTPSAPLEDRLAAALELYRAGKVRRILVSGDHGAGPHSVGGYDEVGAMHAWLRARGVPEEVLVDDHAGFRTLDTMVRAREIFGVREAVVCTNRFHLARSLFLAREAGIEAEGLVSDRRRYQRHHFNEVRETIARAGAFVDVYVIGRRPRILGAPEPIAFGSEPGRDPRSGRGDLERDPG